MKAHTVVFEKNKNYQTKRVTRNIFMIIIFRATLTDVTRISKIGQGETEKSSGQKELYWYHKLETY